jgi:uncharacterized membrane protein
MSDVGVVLLIALAVLYFLPTAIVGIRDKAEGGFGIFIINLLLGWTVIGWLVCFIWACSGRTRGDVRREEQRHAELLAVLKERNGRQ